MMESGIFWTLHKAFRLFFSFRCSANNLGIFSQSEQAGPCLLYLLICHVAFYKIPINSRPIVRAISLSWNLKVSFDSPLDFILISSWFCGTDRLLSIASDQFARKVVPIWFKGF
jgi:hypothetical protein